ncbi:MAG: MarR family transcriptional regulator [Bacteroidetes bacterium]|nr:MAG: MarR family transcriptional regulator [Bacteroidota bacterium]
MPLDFQAFEDSIGAHIARTGSVMGKALHRKLREAGYDISPDHWIVLVHLWTQDGQNQQHLARIAGRNKTSVTRAIDGLEDQNFVVRIVDEEDRRNRRIYLTRHGRALYHELLPHIEALMTEATAGVSETELSLCKQVLGRIFQNLQIPDG